MYKRQDHNAVLESLDDDVLGIYVAKYVDDITIVEAIPRDIAVEEEQGEEKTTYHIHPPQTQIAMDTIASRARHKKMLMNKNKTQILTIHNSNTDYNSFLTDDDQSRINSNNDLRMLGFTFNVRPTVQSQINALVRKANKRSFLLQNYKSNGVSKDKLKTVFTASIRSVLEYTSNTYHPQLNRGQNNLLERVQKKCLKIIYGYGKSYQELLAASGLDTLEVRRARLFDKFTQKTKDNKRYKSWFPKKDIMRDTRKIRPYLEENATSDRFYKSPIFAMSRLLNESPPIPNNPTDLTGLNNEP